MTAFDTNCIPTECDTQTHVFKNNNCCENVKGIKSFNDDCTAKECDTDTHVLTKGVCCEKVDGIVSFKDGSCLLPKECNNDTHVLINIPGINLINTKCCKRVDGVDTYDSNCIPQTCSNSLETLNASKTKCCIKN